MTLSAHVHIELASKDALLAVVAFKFLFRANVSQMGLHPSPPLEKTPVPTLQQTLVFGYMVSLNVRFRVVVVEYCLT